MEGELGNFISVWLTATISGLYCHAVSKCTEVGLLRRLLLLPVAAVFAALPLTLSSYHLGGSAFFFLTWLANSKLLLFSFDSGPLSRHPAADSLLLFLCTLLLPVKLSGPARPIPGVRGPSGARVVRWAKAGGKLLCFGLLVVPYSYKEELPGAVLVALHCGHMYVALETSLALIGALARAGLGLELELATQFDEPYLSTSLQDFWGRRWNLIASDILKETVHNLIRSHGSPLIGKKCAMYVGILTTFLVSGLMHELMYYYITRVSTKWAVMRFFVFHGVCMIIEVMIKTAVFCKWQLHRAISTPLTVGFLAITAVWLLFPSFLINKVYEKAIHEYLVIVKYVLYYILGVEQVNLNIAITIVVESIWGVGFPVDINY